MFYHDRTFSMEFCVVHHQLLVMCRISYRFSHLWRNVLYQVSNQMKLYTTSIKIQTTTFSFIGWVCDGLYALKIYSAYPHMEVLCNLHHLLHDNLRIKIISRSIIWFITRFKIYCKSIIYREYSISVLILLFHWNRFEIQLFG